MLKAKIVDIKKFAVHDGDGIRTTVFFKGCPLACKWCHNPEGISFQPELAYFAHKCVGCGVCARVCKAGAHQVSADGHVFLREKCVGCGVCAEECPGGALTFYGKEMTVEELVPILLEDRDFYENSNGGITVSGGEPLMQVEFVEELLKRMKENGIHTAVDTCGFVSREAIDRVMPYTDIFLYDMKGFDEQVHIHCTGHSNRRILENLEYINRSGKPVEIRIPYVPEYNSDQIDGIGAFLAGLPRQELITKIKVLPYHNYAASKYDSLDMVNTLPQVELPDDATVLAAAARLKEFGLNAFSGRE